MPKAAHLSPATINWCQFGIVLCAVCHLFFFFVVVVGIFLVHQLLLWFSLCVSSILLPLNVNIMFCTVKWSSSVYGLCAWMKSMHKFLDELFFFSLSLNCIVVQLNILVTEVIDRSSGLTQVKRQMHQLSPIYKFL